MNYENKLGRIPAKDPNDKEFPLRAALKRVSPVITSRSWNDTSAFLNQPGNQCVGFSLTHYYIDGPVTHKLTDPDAFAISLYKEAQKVDEWPGENYEGTSVRAGAKIMQAKGILKEYRWAWNINDVIDAVLSTGPVVVGTNWYSRMFETDSLGFIRVGGYIAGGHAYVVNGVNTKKKVFRIKNSWGRGWGNNGRAWITFDDMARLIHEDGEIMLGIENKLK